MTENLSNNFWQDVVSFCIPHMFLIVITSMTHRPSCTRFSNYGKVWSRAFAVLIFHIIRLTYFGNCCLIYYIRGDMSPNFVQNISSVLARPCDAISSYVYSNDKHYSVANDKSGSKYVLKFRSGNDLLFWHALVPQTVYTCTYICIYTSIYIDMHLSNSIVWQRIAYHMQQYYSTVYYCSLVGDTPPHGRIRVHPPIHYFLVTVRRPCRMDW